MTLISLCENTKWTHLPVAGGWYNQHPVFVDHVYIYFAMKSDHLAAEEKERERKAEAEKRASMRGPRRGASRPR